jgi:adenine-specific DNA glycosylase
MGDATGLVISGYFAFVKIMWIRTADQRLPILEANTIRVLSRLLAFAGDPHSAAGQQTLWRFAEEILPAREVGHFNQALMELGATVCSFRRPRCLMCPVSAFCTAFKTGKQTEIPGARRRPATVHVHRSAVVERRGARCRMKCVKGLWEFPMFNDLPDGAFTLAGQCRHSITHHRLDVAVYTGALGRNAEYIWKDPLSVPLSSLTRKILKAAQGEPVSGRDI